MKTMRKKRFALAAALFRAGNLWENSCQVTDAVEDMVNAKMTGHTLIEISLLLLIAFLWWHNKEQAKEIADWQKIVEEHCKR